jgi:hypothetical protein
MFNKTFLFATLALMGLLAGCARPLLSPSDPQPLPSPTADWKISLTQSGGFAGVMLEVIVSSDGKLTAQNQRSGRMVTQNLTADTIARLGGLSSGIVAATPVVTHSGCADCFVYDLVVESGGRSVQIHADDTTLANSSAEDLIQVLQGLRDAALRS